MAKKRTKSDLVGLISNNFTYFVIAVLILTVSTSYALNKRSENLNVKKTKVKKLSLFDVYKDRVLAAEADLSTIPILTEGADFPVLSARNVVAADVGSGVLLYEKNPTERIFPASTTKIITALVSMEVYDPNDVVEVNVPDGVNGRSMGLVNGERLTVESLLYGLLVHSANDAAYVLAGSYIGGYDEFIELMNEKAESLSLENTRFTNPAGYDQEGHYSTAQDLARAAVQAMRMDKFSQIVATKKKSIESVDGKYTHELENTNELLGELDGVLGTKTGWTENADENLITYVERDSHTIVVALLGSQDRFGETEELIEWIYGNYHWREVETPE